MSSKDKRDPMEIGNDIQQLAWDLRDGRILKALRRFQKLWSEDWPVWHALIEHDGQTWALIANCDHPVGGAIPAAWLHQAGAKRSRVYSDLPTQWLSGGWGSMRSVDFSSDLSWYLDGPFHGEDASAELDGLSGLFDFEGIKAAAGATAAAAALAYDAENFGESSVDGVMLPGC